MCAYNYNESTNALDYDYDSPIFFRLSAIQRMYVYACELQCFLLLLFLLVLF